MSWKETDPLSLWKNSTVVPRTPGQDAHIEKTELSKLLDGSRSKLWVQLSQLSPQHREEYLGKLISNWPYKLEKLAAIHPASVSMAVSSLSASFVATKVCADVILYEPKIKLISAFRKSPRKPILFAAWTSGLTSILLNHCLNYQPILSQEGKPCKPCVYGKSIAFGLISGIMIPVLSVPYAVEYVQMQMEQVRPTKETLHDSFVLIYEYSRNVWRYMPAMIGVQVVVGSLTAYTFLWGRDRIFETVDVDPEFIRECIRRADSIPPSMFSWAKNAIKKFDILNLLSGRKDADKETNS